MGSMHLSSSCAVLVVDIQERLLRAMAPEEAARVVRQTTTLVELAASVGADILYTEQYPKGLGETEGSLREVLEQKGAQRFEKTHFDACAAPEFQEALAGLRRRVVLCGMEAHICVQATALSLLERGKEVVVPFDAVTSRVASYRENGLEVMRGAGAVVSNTESLVFHTLGYAGHPEFKRFSKMIQ